MPTKEVVRLSAAPQGFGQSPDDLTTDMFVSDLPVQHTHLYYADDDIGLYVGVWDTTAMIETAGPYACDEFMFLLEGEACIKNTRTGQLEKVVAGETFVIPRGYDCQWQQTGYLRKFFLISEHPHEAIPDSPAHAGIIIPRAGTAPRPLIMAQPFLPKGATVDQQGQVCYTDHTGRFSSGIWQSEAFEADPRPFPYNEFAYVQTGSLTLIDEQGGEHLFKQGDAFFVPQGLVCGARATQKVQLFIATLKSE